MARMFKGYGTGTIRRTASLGSSLRLRCKQILCSETSPSSCLVRILPNTRVSSQLADALHASLQLGHAMRPQAAKPLYRILISNDSDTQWSIWTNLCSKLNMATQHAEHDNAARWICQRSTLNMATQLAEYVNAANWMWQCSYLHQWKDY